jgi:hypothetical protein
VVVAGTVVIVYRDAPVEAVHETSIVFSPMLLRVRFVGAAGRVRIDADVAESPFPNALTDVTVNV